MKIEYCMADFQIPRYLHYMDSAATSPVTEPVIAKGTLSDVREAVE